MKRFRPTLPLILILLSTCEHLTADSPQIVAIVERCQVSPQEDVDVPALETGRIEKLSAKENDQVRKGDVLAKVDDRQAHLQRQAAEAEGRAAQARASDDVEIRYALKEFELRETEVIQTRQMNRENKGTVPLMELKRKELDRDRSELAIQKSRLDMQISQLTADAKAAAVAAADESILRRKIVAPFDGVVFEIFHEESEWVNAGDPLFRLVRMDRLKVEGFLESASYDPAEIIDRQVSVEVELARSRKIQLAGKVVFVSQFVRTGNKYRVRAEVENKLEKQQWLLRPGMWATMQIQLGER